MMHTCLHFFLLALVVENTVSICVTQKCAYTDNINNDNVPPEDAIGTVDSEYGCLIRFNITGVSALTVSMGPVVQTGNKSWEECYVGCCPNSEVVCYCHNHHLCNIDVNYWLGILVKKYPVYNGTTSNFPYEMKGCFSRSAEAWIWIGVVMAGIGIVLSICCIYVFCSVAKGQSDGINATYFVGGVNAGGCGGGGGGGGGAGGC